MTIVSRQTISVASIYGPLAIELAIEQWPLKRPLRISGACWTLCEVLTVTVSAGAATGRGEAAGVGYRGETCETMQREALVALLACSQPVSRALLQTILPPGGARNALDCALWDLEAAILARPVWDLAGFEPPAAVLTTFTCGIDTPEDMARTAAGYGGARAIKLKLAGDLADAERIAAVRDALPDAWLAVDANQALDRSSLEALLPTLRVAEVALLEQPFSAAHDDWLDGLECPVPLAADESAQTATDVPGLVGRVEVVNIKLDKCGGFTAALDMLAACRAHGLRPMVGTMLSTSLGLAPAWLLGQYCEIADLDGPIFLNEDRSPGALYEQGRVSVSAGCWGS